MKKFSLTFSTATLPGLVQAYMQAELALSHFQPKPEDLSRALDNPATKETCISCLQRGATALNALEALSAGDVEYTATLLENLISGAYSEAAALGRPKRTLTVNARPLAVGAANSPQ